MSLTERITINPEICHGKPTIRGLRYPVETILELLSSGMTFEDILADYEDLEREDILAALDYARRITQINHIEPDKGQARINYELVRVDRMLIQALLTLIKLLQADRSAHGLKQVDLAEFDAILAEASKVSGEVANSSA